MRLNNQCLEVLEESAGLALDHADASNHVERLLGEVVPVASHDGLEVRDGVGKVDELARRAGEHLGDVEGLAQELLDLAGARHTARRGR